MLQYGGGEFPALVPEQEGKVSGVLSVYLLNVVYVKKSKVEGRLV